MTAQPKLHALLAASAERAPQQSAFIRREIRTSYGELEQSSSRMAASLRELGVAPGDRVLLVLDGVVDYLIAYYGILKAGAVVVPLCPDTRRDILHHTLARSAARSVIAEARITKLLDGLAAQLPELRHVISVGEPQLQNQGQLQVCPMADLLAYNQELHDSGSGGDDLASIVWTSGTTGSPKGVMLSHRNLVANIRSIVQYLELGPADVIAMVLPFFYVYGNSVLHTHICAGGTIAAVGSVAFPATVLEGIQRYHCTGMSGVPSTFAHLLQFKALSRYDLSSLRYLTQAGGPMTPALTEKLRAALPHVRLFIMYGQTEAAARLAYLPPEDLHRKLGSAGIAIPGVQLRIMDKLGNELPRGTVGEIVAIGENIMLGYWRDEEETARALRPEGLRTGDLAQMDDEGFIYIVARESDMIKSGAHRLSPQEIERVVEKLPEVAECAVVGVPDDLLGEAIAAYVVPAADATVTPKQVLHTCIEQLPRFKVPSYVRVVSSLPRTQTGKLQRNELKRWFAAEQQTGS